MKRSLISIAIVDFFKRGHEYQPVMPPGERAACSEASKIPALPEPLFSGPSSGGPAGPQAGLIARPMSHCLKMLIIVLSISAFCFPLQSCSAPAVDYAPAGSTDQIDVLQAQQSQMRKVEVTVVAPVYKLLRDDTEGLPHQRFLIMLSNGTTVLIAHDTRMAPRVPIKAGDMVKIHGEYIWNPKGGVIHWTHHTDTPRHEGGWIEFQGERYQ